MPEYKAIQESTSIIIQQSQQDLRTEIINASKLEIKAIINEIKYHLVKAIRQISQAFFIGTQRQDISRRNSIRTCEGLY
jgi:hypothetical protein